VGGGAGVVKACGGIVVQGQTLYVPEASDVATIGIFAPLLHWQTPPIMPLSGSSNGRQGGVTSPAGVGRGLEGAAPNCLLAGF
jgi:hypothetical protein